MATSRTTNKEKELILTCPVCGSKSNTLPVIDTYAFGEPGSENIVAYDGCISFCDDDTTPRIGDVLTVIASYPIYCREGDTFISTTEYDDGVFITMRLLKIKKQLGNKAKIQVEIVALGNRLSFVNPVPEEEKKRLLQTQIYDYVAPSGDGLSDYDYIKPNIAQFTNDEGGGDVCFKDYIYTDDDGIDHLAQHCYKDSHGSFAYFGDRVLGFHQFSPYFPPRDILPDGSLAPHIPFGFMKLFTRKVKKEGVATFLQDFIDFINGKRFDMSFDVGFFSCDNLYTYVVFYWIGRISPEGFIYATKKLIENLENPDGTLDIKEIKELYNELTRIMNRKSYNVQSWEKYLF